MHTFLFRCPTTGYNVQGRFEQADGELPTHVGQHCLACGALHIVDPRDGRPLSGASDAGPDGEREAPRRPR